MNAAESARYSQLIVLHDAGTISADEREELSLLDQGEIAARVNSEFPFECECGERYRNLDAAKSCRKCRTYLGHSCEVVYDLRISPVGNTENLVWIHPIVAIREAAIDAHNARLDAEEKAAEARAIADEKAWRFSCNPFNGMAL